MTTNGAPWDVHGRVRNPIECAVSDLNRVRADRLLS